VRVDGVGLYMVFQIKSKAAPSSDLSISTDLDVTRGSAGVRERPTFWEKSLKLTMNIRDPAPFKIGDAHDRIIFFIMPY
jgi:hypothetical protein